MEAVSHGVQCLNPNNCKNLLDKSFFADFIFVRPACNWWGDLMVSRKVLLLFQRKVLTGMCTNRMFSVVTKHVRIPDALKRKA